MILQTLPAGSGWRLFKIEDQLDVVSGPIVETAIAHVAEEGARSLLIDLEAVRTADESGVAALAAGVRQFARLNPHARVAFVVRNKWLVDALRRQDFSTAVEFFRHGIDALRALAPTANQAA